jgi:ribosomal protein S17E
MINSRLIQLYQTLNEKELRAFKVWIVSPIYNKHQDTGKLFDFLNSRQPISKVSVQKKRLFLYLYPKQKYSEAKISYLMNHALNLLKQFLGYYESVLDDFDTNKKLIQTLEERNMKHLANLELEKLARQVNSIETKNAKTSLQQLEIEQKKIELKGTTNQAIQSNLPKLFDHLTDFYALSMLQYACTASSHKYIKSQDYNIRLLDAILLDAAQSTHPIILLYYNIYQSLENKEHSHYFELAEKLFSEHYKLLNKQEQNEVLLLLINYCVKRLNTNEKAFIKKSFKWYRWGLEQTVLIRDYLSRFAYFNIVGLGLKLEEFDWVAAFITEYIQYLPQQFQENYLHYATAKLFFKQKKYTKAQRLFTQIEYDDVFLNLDYKTTLLEIYYEEKDWDSLEALLVSFSRYLRRKTVIAYHKKVYKNIISLTRKLIYLKPYDKAAKKALLEEIKTTKPLVERDWLLKQIELL